MVVEGVCFFIEPLLGFTAAEASIRRTASIHHWNLACGEGSGALLPLHLKQRSQTEASLRYCIRLADIIAGSLHFRVLPIVWR